jgi:hypothetical protein
MEFEKRLTNSREANSEGLLRCWTAHGQWPRTGRAVSWQEFEASALAEPVGLKLGVGCGFRFRAGDGDEKSVLVGEIGGVFLEATAEPATNKIPVVGFFGGALAGDEGGADRGLGRIWQGADNDKPACFRLAGFSDTEEVLALVDTAGAWEFHFEASSETLGCGLKSALLGLGSYLYLPCWVMWRLK